MRIDLRASSGKHANPEGDRKDEYSSHQPSRMICLTHCGRNDVRDAADDGSGYKCACDYVPDLKFACLPIAVLRVGFQPGVT